MSDDTTRPLDPADEPTRTHDDQTLPGSDDLPDLPPGTRIGRYTIESPLGVGGMGAVYRATQQSPHRTVALKLMKPGLVSPRALRRFELESELLGKLTHPGIAQIHEAGMHHGAPYFAMEYVPGPTLTEYAETNKLGTRDRLALFAQICDAVHHAHTKGIIHRDLKPHNILVAHVGEPPKPQPKILDFGVARATDADTQSATMRTDVGQIIGTIPYMSPEQVAADPGDIDTRSDVYALGVVLYELLAGRLPYDLQRKMIHEAARVIREDEPTRLSSINTALRGDVETIVAKALEKDRERRYQTALDLGSDIRRYLTDQPIAARPPSTWYQLTKFSKRNKALVTGTAAAFAALLLGLAGTTYGLIQANTQRQRVEHANTALRAQNDNARTAIEQLLVVSGVFDQYDLAPGQSTSAYIESPSGDTAPHYFTLRADDDGAITIDPGPSTTNNPAASADFAAALPALAVEYTRSALDRERARIHELEQVTEFQAAQLSEIDPPTMGLKLREDLLDKFRARDERDGYDEEEIQSRLTELDKSLNGVDFTGLALETLETNIFERAIMAIDEQFADQPLVQARLLQSIATTAQDLGLLELAADPQQRALRIRTDTLGHDHESTLNSMSESAILAQDTGELDRAEELFRDTLERSRRVLGSDHEDTIKSINNLSHLLILKGDLEQAEPLAREALEAARRTLPENNPTALTMVNAVGYLLHTQGKLSQAVPYYQEALETARAVHSDDHPITRTALNNLGTLLHALGDHAAAAPLLEEAVDSRTRSLGQDHPETLNSISNLAVLYSDMGDHQRAESLQSQALDTRRRTLGDTHPKTLISIINYADLCVSLGRLDEAQQLFNEALDSSTDTLGPDHEITLGAASNLAVLLQSLGRIDQAEPHFRHVLDTAQRILGPEHPYTLSAMTNMAANLRAQGKADEALPLYTAVLETRKRLHGDEHPSTIAAISAMGYFLYAQGKPDQAAPYFQQTLDLRRQTLGPEHPDTLSALSNTGAILRSLGQLDEAIALFTELLETRQRILPHNHPDTIGSMSNLGYLYLDANQPDNAQPILLQALELGQTHLAPDHPTTLQVHRNVIVLYTRLHETDPTANHDQTAAHYQAQLDAILAEQAESQPDP